MQEGECHHPEVILTRQWNCDPLGIIAHQAQQQSQCP
jgi:hypothetical protein